MYDTSSLKVPPLADIPEPVGYKILLALPPVQEKKGNILLPDQMKDKEGFASITGHVVKIGPDAYRDPSRYPTGPWCSVGDWVMFRSYSGTRFKMGDQIFILVNDDTVDGVVPDPAKVERS